MRLIEAIWRKGATGRDDRCNYFILLHFLAVKATRNYLNNLFQGLEHILAAKNPRNCHIPSSKSNLKTICPNSNSPIQNFTSRLKHNFNSKFNFSLNFPLAELQLFIPCNTTMDLPHQICCDHKKGREEDIIILLHSLHIKHLL